MLISHNWLQKYFDKKLPNAEKLAETFPLHSFEVESFLKINGKNVDKENSDNNSDDDVIYDIKTLPDRNHYALCHRGIAYEISAFMNMDMIWNIGMHTGMPTKNSNKISPTFFSKDVPAPEIKIEDKDASVYFGLRVNNIKIAKSPEWLSDSLEKIGQRSINNIVDIANYVMFDIGQPLHAFDADKVVGKIIVRKAKDGEKLMTLDNRDIELDSSMLIIADEESPLAIAGIKGGKKAEVSADTKNLILESANFNPSLIRRTAGKIGLRTDAVKRFENRVPECITEEAIESFASLILELNPEAKFSNITKAESESVKNGENKVSGSVKKARESTKVESTLTYIISRLGANPGSEKITGILNSLKIKNEISGDKIVMTAPAFRLDLNIADDYVDEIGRIWGYENVKPILTPKLADGIEILPVIYYSEKIKNILVDTGYSENYLYSFANKGDIEVMYPIAKDKGALRKNLSDGLVKSLELNANNAPLLGLDSIKIFEIGSVFTKEGEKMICGIGAIPVKKQKGITAETLINEALGSLETELGIKFADKFSKDEAKIKMVNLGNIGQAGVVEFDLNKLIEGLAKPESYADLAFSKASTNKYKKVSHYPFMVRDIAFFVPEDITEKVAWECIEKSLKDSGGFNLIVRNYLFDVFKKDGKISYAFRLIFQSFDKTLTDEEVNEIMKKVYDSVAGNGWQIR
ncbi:MAG: phenylalanine--tRNA ligase subunit beta [bacterium]|nr:phenylalanine--tRNA ligase subunit beta [bacterium]